MACLVARANRAVAKRNVISPENIAHSDLKYDTRPLNHSDANFSHGNGAGRYNDSCANRGEEVTGASGKGKKNQGVFSSEWMGNLADGTYTAEVISLFHDSFSWNQALDPTGNDTDLDGNNRPDQQHSISH